jgi:hypothetical protein
MNNWLFKSLHLGRLVGVHNLQVARCSLQCLQVRNRSRSPCVAGHVIQNDWVGVGSTSPCIASGIYVLLSCQSLVGT